jgi:signal transduction histidine kinase
MPDEALGDGGRQLFLAMTRSRPKASGPITVTIAGDDPLDPLAAVEPMATHWTRVEVPLMRDERPIGVACLYLEDEVRLAHWELEAFRRRGEITALGVEAVGLALTNAAERERSYRIAFELLTGYRRIVLREVLADLTRCLPAATQQRLRETLPGLIQERRIADVGADAGRSELVSTVLAEISSAFTELWESTDLPRAVEPVIDANDLVTHAVHIVKTSFAEILDRHDANVDLSFEPSTEPVLIQGSPVLVGAIVHAIENAVEAMPHGGKVQILTARDNGHVVIYIRDQGAGIPAALTETVFSPLYSTKGGPHLGLGLSIVRTVVQRHGGTALLSASEATGTELAIRIPAVPTPGGSS